MPETFNELNQVPIAHLNTDELQSLKQLEEKLGSKYYLIAFERD